ncbi:hypothetical protein AAG747_06650 [Rapidithrix thailandica]|uniref:SGNH/GDSL hydrolase family protein n=1 Tax=Rapidithrix thailandica TaxID=413964 RepID=A0AAW9RV63_9BACT
MIVFINPWWNTAQNQWHQNLMKAQEFIYRDTPVKRVILGSSLSALLIMDSLPDTKNLAFSGQSIFDGLEILTQMERPPKEVYIETNMVMRGKNKYFAEALSSPFPFPIKKHLPSLQEKNQPLAVLGGVVTWQCTYKIIHLFKTQTTQPLTQQQVALKEATLSYFISQNSQLPKPEQITRVFTTLKRLVRELEAKGITISFFEMPVHPELCDLPCPNAIREAFSAYFPPSEYAYIPLPDCQEYTTSDGYHLIHESSFRYALYLKQHIQTANWAYKE